ncbi:hypothetical protein KJ627_03720, partial [Patescibacteria group bacterium]|nr:hypothetical protein [Patescibacteria group bacterium]
TIRELAQGGKAALVLERAKQARFTGRVFYEPVKVNQSLTKKGNHHGQELHQFPHPNFPQSFVPQP